MDNLLGQYNIHLESLTVDFTDFIEFLKQYQKHLQYSDEVFMERFYALYTQIFNDSLNVLSRDVCDGKEIKPNEAPIDRIRRMQEKRAKLAAKSFLQQLDFFKLDPKMQRLFTTSIAYCLLCRFKSIADPMDHQIREGLKPKT
jgi:hypothetical protein